jgi:hypothetical protein
VQSGPDTRYRLSRVTQTIGLVGEGSRGEIQESEVVTEDLCSRVTQRDGCQVQSGIKSGGHYLQQSKVLITGGKGPNTQWVHGEHIVSIGNK